MGKREITTYTYRVEKDWEVTLLVWFKTDNPNMTKDWCDLAYAISLWSNWKEEFKDVLDSFNDKNFAKLIKVKETKEIINLLNNDFDTTFRKTTIEEIIEITRESDKLNEEQEKREEEKNEEEDNEEEDKKTFLIKYEWIGKKLETEIEIKSELSKYLKEIFYVAIWVQHFKEFAKERKFSKYENKAIEDKMEVIKKVWIKGAITMMFNLDEEELKEMLFEPTWVDLTHWVKKQGILEITEVNEY